MRGDNRCKTIARRGPCAHNLCCSCPGFKLTYMRLQQSTHEHPNPKPHTPYAWKAKLVQHARSALLTGVSACRSSIKSPVMPTKQCYDVHQIMKSIICIRGTLDRLPLLVLQDIAEQPYKLAYVHARTEKRAELAVYLVIIPGLREGSSAGILKPQCQCSVSCTSHPEVEPPARSVTHCHSLPKQLQQDSDHAFDLIQ